MLNASARTLSTSRTVAFLSKHIPTQTPTLAQFQLNITLTTTSLLRSFASMLGISDGVQATSTVTASFSIHKKLA